MDTEVQAGAQVPDQEAQAAADTLLAAIQEDQPVEETTAPAKTPVEDPAVAAAPETPIAPPPAVMTPEQQSALIVQQAAMIEQLKAGKQTPAEATPVVDTAEAEYAAQVTRVTPHYNTLYTRYVAQGYTPDQAKAYAWEDAVAMDEQARANAQEMVRQQLGPYAEMVERELMPATVTREIQAVIGADVPATEVMQCILDHFGGTAAELAKLPPNTRMALYNMGKDAVRGRKGAAPAAPVKAPPQTATPTLTSNTARGNAAPKLTEQQTAKIRQYQRAFPSLSAKDLAEIIEEK